jgi:hypothetical protein
MRRPKLLSRLGFAALLVTLPALADAPADQYEQFDRDSTSIKDAHTLLQWERRPAPTPFSGGRLPTVKELLTIVDEAPHDEYVAPSVVSKFIDGLAFPDTPVDRPYWTSSPGEPGLVWAVDFGTGLMTPLSATTGQAYARCLQ